MLIFDLGFRDRGTIEAINPNPYLLNFIEQSKLLFYYFRFTCTTMSISFGTTAIG